jgi:PhoH-like ATPase
MAKKTYVLDTSVCLSDADCINQFKNNDVVLPIKVLEEIDNHKKRQDGVGANARKVIRLLDALRERGSLSRGVRLGKGKGILSVSSYHDIDLSLLPLYIESKHADHVIIATALTIFKENEGTRRKVILVSRDINMRVIGNSLGLICEDYATSKAVSDCDILYTGFTEHLVDDQVIERFYDKEEIILDKEEGDFYRNQYVMLVSNLNEKRTALSRFIDYGRPLAPIKESKIDGWNIKARNKEQSFAIDLLMDRNVEVVTLIGRAGSGKTLCAIAAGLEQVVGSNNYYSRLIVSRPVMPMGKDIGFLPGSLEDKMAPWLAPIKDNLEFLTNNDANVIQDWKNKGLIEVEALTYIRGRSISNAFIIIDEAQNLTMHEVKTILTRVGEGTKIVLTGDIEQIDNVYTDETSNGLTHVVEKFKDQDFAGHVTLRKGERSNVATAAAKIL